MGEMTGTPNTSSLSSVQRATLEMIRPLRWNAFEGSRIVADLESHTGLWSAAFAMRSEVGIVLRRPRAGYLGSGHHVLGYEAGRGSSARAARANLEGRQHGVGQPGLHALRPAERASLVSGARLT